MNIRTKTIETMIAKINVVRKDIDGGVCLKPSLCMEKVAIERALRELDRKGGDHHVKVDGGSITFNLGGYKWRALTPKIAKLNLMQFDKEAAPRRRIEAKGGKFESKVQPHHYKIEAVRGDKIKPMPPGRQEQINAARKRRILAGKPDKQKYTFHDRVAAMGNV